MKTQKEDYVGSKAKFDLNRSIIDAEALLDDYLCKIWAWNPRDAEICRTYERRAAKLELKLAMLKSWVTPNNQNFAAPNEPPACGNSDTTARNGDGRTSRGGSLSLNNQAEQRKEP